MQNTLFLKGNMITECIWKVGFATSTNRKTKIHLGIHWFKALPVTFNTYFISFIRSIWPGLLVKLGQSQTRNTCSCHQTRHQDIKQLNILKVLLFFHISLSNGTAPSVIITHTTQTSISCCVLCPGIVGTMMSKQVSIITRDLHRLTQNSNSPVACARASR